MKYEGALESNKWSFEKINYLLRPQKQVERKLIIETLQCLRKKFQIENYLYVGMGSIFYVDYYMFHKYVGIKKMVSMEKNEDNIARFLFNKPYNFISLLSGTSTEILPTLDWQNDMLIWLDYDNKISQSIVNDIQIICQNIQSGGIFIITVDAEPKRFESPNGEKFRTVNEDRLGNFKKELYPYFPTDISKMDLSLKRFPLLLRKTITNVIKEELWRREIEYVQIMNFKYRDTSQMYTFCCVFSDTVNKIEETGVFELDFVSKDERLIEINLPIITQREKLHFDKLIPGIAANLIDFEMDKSKLDDYEKYYKYYPQYFESLF
ncbi:MAG: hypothetical protein QQN41_07700 [Nitrosopumilus sp.]